MSGAGTDLIAGYLAELRAGLWVPAAEAELIVAEAEDHLRETAAVGIEIGLTELEAQQAAISSFGSVRAVVQAHRRRFVTAGDAAMAAWKLTGLLAATVGIAGLASVLRSGVMAGLASVLHSGVIAGLARMVHSGVIGTTVVRVIPPGATPCQCSVNAGPFTTPVPIASPAVMALPYAALAAGGLALLATRWLATRWLATRRLATRRLAIRRLARHGTSVRDPLSPAVTAGFFLLVSVLLFAVNASGVGAVTQQVSNWLSPVSSGSMTMTVPLVPGAIVVGCLAVAAGYGLRAALGRARRRPGPGAPVPAGPDPLSPALTAGFFLLVSALVFALDVTGVGGVIRQVTWLNLPLSAGSTTTSAPLVPGAIVAGCLALAVGFGLQTALKLGRRGPGSCEPALPGSGPG